MNKLLASSRFPTSASTIWSRPAIQVRGRCRRLSSKQAIGSKKQQARAGDQGDRTKLKSVEDIKAAIEAAVPGATVRVISNPAPSAQHSLLIDAQHAVSVAEFLRDDEELALDYLSNCTGVDYLDKEIAEKIKVT